MERLGKFTKKLTAIALSALALLATSAGGSANPTPTQPEVDAKKREIESYATRIEELKNSTVSLSEKMGVASARSAKFSEQYARASAELRERSRVYANRIVALYKLRGTTSLDYLLGSRNLSQLMNRFGFITRISSADKRLIDEITINRAQAERSKAQAELEEESLEAMRADLERQLKEMNAAMAEAQGKLKGMVFQLEEARRKLASRGVQRSAVVTTPVGTTPALKDVIVDPYVDLRFVTTSKAPNRFRATGTIIKGDASWYGNEFNGRHTANGEIFNEEDFTAASKELPFNTYLAVTYKDKRIIVRINDRGPYVAGRFLDLSKGAARALGFGVGELMAEIVAP